MIFFVPKKSCPPSLKSCIRPCKCLLYLQKMFFFKKTGWTIWNLPFKQNNVAQNSNIIILLKTKKKNLNNAERKQRCGRTKKWCDVPPSLLVYLPSSWSLVWWSIVSSFLFSMFSVYFRTTSLSLLPANSSKTKPSLKNNNANLKKIISNVFHNKCYTWHPWHVCITCVSHFGEKTTVENN